MAKEVTINPIEVFKPEDSRDSTVVNLPVQKANQLAQTYLEQMSYGGSADIEAALRDLRKLVERVVAQLKHSGDANDWHNFTVDIARHDLYDLACDVLQCGLNVFPKNIDLLADFLQYGASCGRTEECERYYAILSRIPKIRWGWRGYSFGVNWLKYLWERSDTQEELYKLQEEMLDIAKHFLINLPNDEESYRCLADVYKLLHRTEEEEKTIRLALEKLKIAPKCALRLADIMFSRGEYAEALGYIRRGINNAMQTQASVSEHYLFYLSGLSKLAMAQDSGSVIDEATALDIYSDFDVALR